MLVAGTMIGSGIFIVSADIARDVGSSGWLLVVWVLTGVMTIIGALSYAELAAMMPHAGGQYVYLREAYSPLWGFLYGWTVLPGHPDRLDRRGRRRLRQVPRRARARSSAPTTSSVDDRRPRHQARRLPRALDGRAADVLRARRSSRSRPGQLVAVGVIALLTLLNCRGVQEGKLVQNVFTVAKTLALIAADRRRA